MQIGKYYLDKTQEEIVKTEATYLLVTAGAGSGKTLTILGKIAYLINEKGFKETDILCLTFTNAAALSLKEKIKNELNLTVPTYTFHKLSLEILKDAKIEYEIADSNILEAIVNEFFTDDIYNSPYLLNLLLKYLKIPKQKQQEISKEELYQLEKTCISFIRLMKCNNYKLSDFLIFLSKIKKTLNYRKYRQEKIILTMILNCFIKYQTYLIENNEIDFDDMIIKATKLITEYFSKDIKYIIIDEYQDTSLIRFNLIKEIIKKTNSKLMVVGDDFQSIYKFTGCDISLFLKFSTYFPDAKIMKLEQTYRNSQELIEIAGKFIMKNKYQIKKELYSKKNLKDPIKIINYHDIQKSFLQIVKKLSNNINQKILVLGRNNFDINYILNSEVKLKKDKLIIKDYENLDITYMTIHKSKGLESDNVILLNLKQEITGFPSQIKDNQLFRLINKKDSYPYSEERRLFYVALTRTKNYVYLLVPNKNPSIFIEELKKIKNS